MADLFHIAIVTLEETASSRLEAALDELDLELQLHKFSSLSDADQALEAESYQYAACVIHAESDILDGLAFYEKNLSGKGVPTVFLCNEAPRELVLQALSSGIDELIEKDTEGHYLDFLPHSLGRIIDRKIDSQARLDAESALQSISQALADVSGKEFFRQLTIKLSEALNVDYSLVGEARGIKRKKIRTIAVCERGQTQPNFEYLTQDRPSADIIKGRPHIISDGLVEKFPDDKYTAKNQFVSYAGVPLRNNRGEICGILSILDRKPLPNPDIVEAALKLFAARAEIEMERVRIQEAMFTQARMLDQIGLAIICTETDGQIKSWNSHAEELLGYKRTDILGKNLDVVLPGTTAESLSANILEPLLIRGQLSLETRMRPQNDAEFEAAVTFSLEKSPKEEITGIILCCRDISERRRALRKQREAQQRLSLHLKHTSLGFIEWDKAGHITAWNEAAERIFGYRAEEIIGRSFKELVLPEFYADCEAIFKALVNGQGGERSTNENVRKDGTIITCEWHNTALMNEADEVFGLASLVDDISERIANEKELRESQQAAAQANKSKDEFLAVMSHEIRTPMNSIIGFADLLLETQIDEAQRDNLEIIKSNAYQLLDLINNVLNFSRLDSSDLILEKRELDLPALLFEIEEAMGAEASQKDLNFKTHIDPALPRHIHTAYLELRQILLSLVGNAIKFTQQGSVALNVAGEHTPVEGTPGQWQLRFEIRDTGIGIEEKNLERIFTTFSQVDSSSTRKFGGTGLGLAICRKLCTLLGGNVWAESKPGVGSTFYVELGVEGIATKGRSQPPVKIQEEPRNLAEYSSSYPTKVLVVDDKPESRLLLCDMLKGMGYECDVADGGVQCIEQLQNSHYDLVFMDVALPDIDGLETTELIRKGQASEGNTDVYICAVSAYSDGDDRQRCLSAGMNDHIGKPLLTKSLCNVIRKAFFYKSRAI